MEALFSGRFYLLFAFLFGYSFTLQIAAAQRAGVSANPRLLRRCAALLVIGLAHVFLLWIGDILTLYAFLCQFLILLRWLRPRAYGAQLALSHWWLRGRAYGPVEWLSLIHI